MRDVMGSLAIKGIVTLFAAASLVFSGPHSTSAQQSPDPSSQQNHFAILALPGDGSYGTGTIEGLTKMGCSVGKCPTFIIGDGETNFTLQRLSDELTQNLKERKGKTTLFVLAHGDNVIVDFEPEKGEQYTLDEAYKTEWLANGFVRYKSKVNIRFSDFLEAIKKAAGNDLAERPMEIVLAPCYGASFANYIGELTEGLTTSALTPAHLKSNPFDIFTTMFSLFNNKAGAKDLEAKDFILAHIVKNASLNNVPAYFVPNKGFIDPLKGLHDIIGMQLTPDRANVVRTALDGLLSPDEVNDTLGEISKATKLTDLKNPNHALAVGFVASIASDAYVASLKPATGTNLAQLTPP